MVCFRLSSLLACAFIFVGVQAGAQAPHAMDLRIMPLGASQTAGTGSSDGNGWRKTLRNLLQADGHTVSLVGTQVFGNIPTPNNDVEAYPGYTISGVYKKALASGAFQLNPNVIVTTLGTNNCIQGSSDPFHDGVTQMGQLLEHVHENVPSALTLVAGIVPWLGDHSDCVLKLNAGILQAVANQQAYGQNVQYVSLFDVLDTTVDYISDGIHPNDGGYVKLAAAWHSAFQSFSGSITAPR